MLCEIIEKIRDEDEILEKWKEGYLVKLPKKEILGNTKTIEELCFSLYQGRS